MSRGIVVLAQNTIGSDYVRQACVLAMSLRKTNPTEKISIITNDRVPKEYQEFFDKIILIPFQDDAEDALWKIENRWKIYHATPYDETMVLDADMLILSDISHIFDIMSNYELFFASDVYTYRGEKVTSDFYRKTFVANNLPNLYSGMHYFKKCDKAHEFYTWLEVVNNNWQNFYQLYLPNETPSRNSVDVNAALVAKILDVSHEITNGSMDFVTFTHMKSKIQNWQTSNTSWIDSAALYINENIEIKIGNYLQQGIFHYTEEDFLTEKLEDLYRGELNVGS